MGRFDGAVSGIRSLLNSAPAPRVTAEIDPDVAQSLGRIGGDDARRVYERLVANGTDEQTAAIIARGVETGVPQTLPRGPYREAVRPPVFDPDAGRYLDTLRIRGVEAPRAPEPDFTLDSPLFRDMYKADQAFDNLRKGRTGNLRNQNRDLVKIAGDNIRSADDAARAARQPEGLGRQAAKAAAAGAAIGGGLALMTAPKPVTADKSDLTESDNPADMEEPVSSSAELTPEIAEPVDYSLQARELINKLNAMRRQAGGEVPEAPAMQKEIERLLALGNQTRRATAVAAPGDDASRLYQQAQMLIDQVNQMYRQGASQGSPEVLRIMQQVRQLQAQGDAIRNRRVG